MAVRCGGRRVRPGLSKVRLESSFVLFRFRCGWQSVFTRCLLCGCDNRALLVWLGLLACTDGNGQVPQPGRTGDSGCLLLLPLLMQRERRTGIDVVEINSLPGQEVSAPETNTRNWRLGGV